MGSVSTSKELDALAVMTLVPARYTGLRISIAGEGITARSLLTGDLPSQPLVGNARQRGKASDLVGTYWAGVFLISERFRVALTELNATGWLASAVGVEGVDEPLWLLSVYGNCGPLFGVGGAEVPGGPKIGTFIDASRWDGSDLFAADNYNAVFVQGMTANKIETLRLSNVAFEPASLEPLPRD
jgi:hypothetical protein